MNIAEIGLGARDLTDFLDPRGMTAFAFIGEGLTAATRQVTRHFLYPELCCTSSHRRGLPSCWAPRGPSRAFVDVRYV